MIGRRGMLVLWAVAAAVLLALAVFLSWPLMVRDWQAVRAFWGW